MWARVTELMLGCWLAMSPFIFRHAADDRTLWVNDLFSALAVIVLALVSFWPPLRFAHVANLVIALWLITFGFWASPYHTPPALQNDIVVGLLLLMFAIIPNEATRPPRPWRDFFARAQQRLIASVLTGKDCEAEVHYVQLLEAAGAIDRVRSAVAFRNSMLDQAHSANSREA